MNDQFDNTGILFRDEDKQNEKDRDYRGSCTIEGIEFWVSGWIKEGRKGKFLSLSFKAKEPRKPAVSGANRPATQSAAARTVTVEPDDIPF